MGTEESRILYASLKRCGFDIGVLASSRSAANIQARRRVVAEMRACRTRNTEQLTLAQISGVTGLHWSTVRNYASACTAKPWTLK